MTRILHHSAPIAAATVGLSAAVATAHGVFEVVSACGVPPAVASLYPLITDGLALVGYACALRLPNGPRRWAWAVVIVAAGLSGVGQATLLGGGVDRPPTWLRFGVGAWPAIAAALVAHLLFLMAASNDVDRTAAPGGQHVQPSSNAMDDHAFDGQAPSAPAVVSAALLPGPALAPAKERALVVACELRDRADVLPTVSELALAAGVARGTAATALRELRAYGESTARRARRGEEGPQ
jgi:hypothetical protein